MSKNKTILVVIFLLALIPLTANASITRVIGFGGSDAVFIIRDAFTPSVWPQLVVDYPRLAGAEFGSFVSGYTADYVPISSWGFTKAYINYDFGPGKSVVHFGLDKGVNPRYSQGPRRLLLTEGGYNRLSFIYGRPLGDMKVGLAINYTGKSSEKDVETAIDTVHSIKDQFEASYSTYGARFGLTALENKLDLALGVEFVSFSDDGLQGEIRSFDTTRSKSTWENDGSMSLSFVGRYWCHVNDQYSLIPNLRYSMMKDAGKGDWNNEYFDAPVYSGSMETGSMGNTVTEFALGMGNNWKPVENVLAVFEVGILSQTNKYEESYTERNTWTHSGLDTTIRSDTSYSKDFSNSLFNVYWRLGFETKIFDWLNGRFGAERTWKSLTKEWTVDQYNQVVEASGKPKYGTAITNTYLGATVHWNRLYIDLLVEPMFMRNGPYFISGQSTDIFSRVSLFYKFKE
ncbi:hypothetical protein KKH27_03690 [bacterium]|nr:hypothetical protein [bacterium]MBU1984268.1 hypothetical protein [bacterium]